LRRTAHHDGLTNEFRAAQEFARHKECIHVNVQNAPNGSVVGKCRHARNASNTVLGS
jgi:hypothetical protein